VALKVEGTTDAREESSSEECCDTKFTDVWNNAVDRTNFEEGESCEALQNLLKHSIKNAQPQAFREISNRWYTVRQRISRQEPHCPRASHSAVSFEIPELPVHQDMATAGRGVLLVWHKHRARLKAKSHTTERREADSLKSGPFEHRLCRLG
jgi:hypothetical protein